MFETVENVVDALKFAETIRQRKFNGEKISHVTTICEHPDNTGKAGVDIVGPDYNWKKRRL